MKVLIDSMNFVLSILSGIWNYKLLVVDRHPITISNLIIAFILFIVAHRFAKILSRAVRGRFLVFFYNKNNTYDNNLSRVIERIVYYLLMAISTVIVLQIANIPMTAFTFIGGALAIGLGFGSQNIINNLISGLIIMIEQPIRIGDVIEYEKIIGTVKNIGARCTQIVTGDNYDIIIPNSTLLQSTIVNLTLTSDGIIRTTFDIAVMSLHDAEEVKELVYRSCLENSYIIKDRSIDVFLSTIESSEMVFKIYFWYQVTAGISKSRIIDSMLSNIHKSFLGHDIKFSEGYVLSKK